MSRLLRFLQNHPTLRRTVYCLCLPRARVVVDRIRPYLNDRDLILDLGSGTCNVLELLLDQRLRVVPLDIQNLSFVDDVGPVIYDGTRMPFRDDQFEIALVLFVLHHISEPMELLLEARRVSRRMLIIEDVYTTCLHRYLTSFLDSLLNLEFARHPHTNKRDSEWQSLFHKLGLRILNIEYNRFAVLIRQVLYFLESQTLPTSYGYRAHRDCTR